MEGLGRSVGGLSTKLHAVVDALGLPIRLCLTPGQASDAPIGPKILNKLPPSTYVLADKAYDNQHMAAAAHELNAQLTVPSKRNRKQPRAIDTHVYKERHLVECYFGKLKRCRRLATRYEQTAASFLGFAYLASTLIWLN